MSTSAKKTFDQNIERARHFLEIHEAGHQTVGAPKNWLRELPRAAVVFAIGALDCYVSELSAHWIVSNLEKKLATADTRDVLKQVQKDVPTLALEVATIENKGDRIQRIQEAIADHFHNRVSNHGKNAVIRVVERIGGNPTDFWSSLKSKGYRDITTDLDDWTLKRHAIVHKGEKVRVPRSSAWTCINLITAIVDEIERVFTSS